MIETSLGITAAAHFAPLLDYADFDGAALLSDDPYTGATILGGRIARFRLLRGWASSVASRARLA